MEYSEDPKPLPLHLVTNGGGGSHVSSNMALLAVSCLVCGRSGPTCTLLDLSPSSGPYSHLNVPSHTVLFAGPGSHERRWTRGTIIIYSLARVGTGLHCTDLVSAHCLALEDWTVGQEGGGGVAWCTTILMCWDLMMIVSYQMDNQRILLS